MSLQRISIVGDPVVDQELDNIIRNADFEEVITDLNIKNGNSLYIYDSDNNHSLRLYSDGSNINASFTSGNFNILDGTTVLIFDNNNSNFIDMYHDLTDGNIDTSAGDLKLSPAGVLRFGTHTGLGAEALSGYITVKDSAGNSRKLAVIS